ncbi:MAG: YgiT-type zinc finger protein [Vicinamibacterales bacterium]
MRCGGALARAEVRTVLWRTEVPTIVEDIPALACAACVEQFYDDAVSDALRRIAEAPPAPTRRSASCEVPVFSLRTRLPAPRPLPEDCLVD